jgi:hypothetical protein
MSMRDFYALNQSAFSGFFLFLVVFGGENHGFLIINS